MGYGRPGLPKIFRDGISTAFIRSDAVTNAKILNGTIDVGTGTHKAFCGKLDEVFVSVNTATVGKSVAVSHGLGRAPVGKYLIKCSTLNGLTASKAALWVQGSTADTTTVIKIKSYATNARLKFRVF